MKYPRPVLPAMDSAMNRMATAVPVVMRNAVNSDGSDAGTIRCAKVLMRPAPRLRMDSTAVSGMARAASRMVTTI